MTCKETQIFMDGYLDGELDLMRSIELERHLHECPACEALHLSRVAVRAAMGGTSLRYAAPAALKKSVRAALSEQDRKERKPRWLSWHWQLAAATAAAAALIAIVWLRPGPDAVEIAAVDSHVRSLMANHLVDVPSTDQHTVKPWFAGKLDFSPPVRDFAAEGFPLIGGRLDYFDGRPVAAVVYRKNQHVINVFVWPAPGERALRASERQGYNVIETARGGMQYCFVSDLNPAELRELAEKVIQ